MLRRRDLRDFSGDYRNELPRAVMDVEAALSAVVPLCDDVAARGDAAVLDAGERFDHVRPDSLRVPAHLLESALNDLDPTIRAALEVSIERLRATCVAELEQSITTTLADGAVVERRIVPMDRVGLYVPGGLAPLVSTVVMNAVPAQVAGVGAIALASPPQAEHGGWPHPTILAACALLGVDEVYAAGGAQALAMFAHGTESCPNVNLITGPGNIYVAAAKRHLQSLVAIDAEAGPTEIAIIADDTANPRFVAADLLSQAEHDPLAAAVLITDSEDLAAAVDEQIDELLTSARHVERMKTSLGGEQSGVCLVRDIDQAIDVADAYAAEHLEIQTADAAAVAARVRNAGAIFVGDWAPVSLGDYSAGSNHVLPTGGCACHSSGLSVRAFCKNVHVVTYSQSALAEVADGVVALAHAEDLPSHGVAVSVRAEQPLHAAQPVRGDQQ